MTFAGTLVAAIGGLWRRRGGVRVAATAACAAAALALAAPAMNDAVASEGDAAGAKAQERVLAALSQNAVGIDATFSGSEIFIFGAIDRDRLADENGETVDLIVAITGPSEPVVLRKKQRRLGIWVNVDSVEIDAAPSFYAVATTGPFRDILTRTADLRHKITVERAIRLVGEAQNVEDPAEFSDAILRLRRASGVYSEAIGAVEVIGGALFRANIELPANIVEGDYEARVYLLREGRVIDDFATAIEVRKVGLERWIYNLAHQRPLLYGILSILVALFAGWGASEAFRLLRR